MGEEDGKCNNCGSTALHIKAYHNMDGYMVEKITRCRNCGAETSWSIGPRNN